MTPEQAEKPGKLAFDYAFTQLRYQHINASRRADPDQPDNFSAAEEKAALADYQDAEYKLLDYLSYLKAHKGIIA